MQPSLQKRRHLLCALTIALLASSQNVWAWGKAGHQVIGMIAENNLTPEVHEKISYILDNQSLAEASIWPDQIKFVKGWTHTRTYHYVSIDDNSNYYDTVGHLTEAQQKQSDIVRALLKAEDMLKDDWSSKIDKANAIRFLVHFIGDLHQPLHVGRYEDTGGNAIKLKWFGAQTNLHSIWDNSIISTFIDRAEKLIKTSAHFLNVFNPLEGAVQINATGQPGGEEIYPHLPTANPKEISEWQSSYIMTWLEESKNMRDDVYYKHTGDSEYYFQKNHDELNVRLLQAGYRLAAWLNALLENEDFKYAESAEVREQLSHIIGENYEEQTVLVNKAGIQQLGVLLDEEAANPLFDHDCNH